MRDGKTRQWPVSDRWGILTCCLLAMGCGSGGLTPATGIVLLDGEPLSQAKVTFTPSDGTNGPGGMGITDAAGRFKLFNPQGKTGLLPGTYRVTVNKVELKGDFEEGIAIAATDAKELLPPRYSSPLKTELLQTILAAGDEPIRLELASERKK